MARAWTPEEYKERQDAINKRMNRELDAMPVAPEVYPVTKENKYHNVQMGKYASKKESKRAEELKLLQAAGAIRELHEQVRFELIPNQYVDGVLVEKAVTYVADAAYWDCRTNEYVVEDVKSPATKTPVYIVKRKLMLHIHHIKVREV